MNELLRIEMGRRRVEEKRKGNIWDRLMVGEGLGLIRDRGEKREIDEMGYD